MRVASRRLRAVLEIFAPCFEKSDFKPVLREVKKLADALGERRDPDVQIAGLQTLEDAVPAAARPGIEALLERVRERQARGNETLAAALERMGENKLERRLQALTEAVG
jgi:CHAD domain-containing protein